MSMSRETQMSRVQLALNVSNLEEAITFYSKLFGAEPANVREGYANFAIVDPPLKLVLIEGGQGGSINHLGVEVETTAAVAAATQRLADEGLGTDGEQETTCCFAVQDKVWVSGPDHERWEVYTVLGDAESFSGNERCCAAEMTTEPLAVKSSCC